MPNIGKQNRIKVNRVNSILELKVSPRGWICSTFGLCWLLDNSVSSGSSTTSSTFPVEQHRQAVEIDSRGDHRTQSSIAPEPNQVNVHARAHFVILLSAGGSSSFGSCACGGKAYPIS